MSGSELKNNWYDEATLLSVPQNLPGITVVIAPHPDDESLGCGGTIALLKQAGKKVYIIFVSDGSMSHPNSKKYTAPLLMRLRETEALKAAQTLGVSLADCSFMRLKDGAVPTFGEIGFTEAVVTMTELLKKINPDTIFLPWKNDPHRDHQACWQIVHAAVLKGGLDTQFLHYLIWFWERGTLDHQLKDEVKWCRIDISSVIDIKKQAIAAHASQVSSLIDDDDKGFMLSAGVLSHFNDAFELFALMKN